MKQRPWWKRLVVITTALLVAGLVSALAYLRMGRDPKEEVRTGKLGYTAEAGWINWGHANQDGIVRFLDAFRTVWRAADGKPFRVSYAQSMNGVYGGIRVESLVEREYQISSCSDDTALEKIAFGIFRETSEAFETMQGEFPNAIDARSQESSFREGDLRGNLIAFYMALRGYSEKEVRSWLGWTSVADSLAQLETHPIGKSLSWEWPKPVAEGRLDEIHHDPVWFAQHASLVRETRTNFRFGLR